MSIFKYQLLILNTNTHVEESMVFIVDIKCLQSKLCIWKPHLRLNQTFSTKAPLSLVIHTTVNVKYCKSQRTYLSYKLLNDDVLYLWQDRNNSRNVWPETVPSPSLPTPSPWWRPTQCPPIRVCRASLPAILSLDQQTRL